MEGEEPAPQIHIPAKVEQVAIQFLTRLHQPAAAVVVAHPLLLELTETAEVPVAGPGLIRAEVEQAAGELLDKEILAAALREPLAIIQEEEGAAQMRLGPVVIKHPETAGMAEAARLQALVGRLLLMPAVVVAMAATRPAAPAALAAAATAAMRLDLLAEPQVLQILAAAAAAAAHLAARAGRQVAPAL